MLDSIISQPEAVDFQVRLRQLERENAHLRELVRSLTEAATSSHATTASAATTVFAAARRQAPAIMISTGLRECEFCGCNTNAQERLCCASGRSADRQSWDPA
ncbi:MAG TPA: hypothetical protein VKP66_09855 [Steroidobacteraceae bacterium]|nr:hypothetical protein [Steroidobacteraceae bacterium]